MYEAYTLVKISRWVLDIGALNKIDEIWDIELAS